VTSTLSRNDPRETPAMRQYRRFKEAHPGCLLLFRMGDFYELFNEDAVTAHKALGITLTERTKGVPMAGVPFHAVENYLRKLVLQGFRVAVCEQIEDPKQAKGIVDRAVTRVVTPGTLVDESLLDESSTNLVGAITMADAETGFDAFIALSEISTGSFTLHRIAAGTLLDELARLAPAELLHIERDHDDAAGESANATIAEFVRRGGGVLTSRPAWMFRRAEGDALLKSHFKVARLEGFGLSSDDPLLEPAGALLRYLQETQAGGDERRLAHLRPPRIVERTTQMVVDAASLRSLEVERTMRSGSIEGSLLWSMQRCRTPMGKRLLREWLCFPLCDRAAIEARHACVAALVCDPTLGDSMGAELARIQDLARIAGRGALGRATARDLVALGRSLSHLPALMDSIDGIPAFAALDARLSTLAEELLPLGERLVRTCVDDPPAHMRDGGLVRDGIDEELDEARRLQKDAGEWLSDYQRRLIERTGIPSLKVGFNRVFGYYIEVTHAHTGKVPDDFTRRQTLRGAERYVTDELRRFEERSTTAEARALAREQAIFAELCALVSASATALGEAADAVAELDLFVGLADLAVQRRLVRPVMCDEPTLELVQARHPVLDQMLGGDFVPNDCTLRRVASTTDADERGDQSASLALITGPNMAGKSTYIRQTALIVLMAHAGSFVPAERAVIGLADRIHTRIGAADELHAGQSTFMVEMTETAAILHHATERSIVVLDEIGRGTSTLDGLSLAWAIAETLAARRCRTLFATHYHELTGLADRLDAVTNLQVQVQEWDDQVVFLHRIRPGRTDRSYGIHVARLAGLPEATIRRAGELLETLAVQTEAQAIDPPRHGPAPGAQLSLFTEYLDHPAIDRLKATRLESLTPLAAFDLLRTLVELAARGPAESSAPKTTESDDESGPRS